MKIHLEGANEYPVRLDVSEWETLAAAIEVRQSRVCHQRESARLASALAKALEAGSGSGTARFLGDELYWVGRIDVSRTRLTGELSRIGNKMVQQITRGSDGS